MFNSRVRDRIYPVEETPEQTAQKAAEEKQARLRANAAKILADQKVQQEREAAERTEAERKRNVTRVNLCIDGALAVALASEREEVLKRVAAKYSQEQVLALDNYQATSLYSDTLAALRDERDRD